MNDLNVWQCQDRKERTPSVPVFAFRLLSCLCHPLFSILHPPFSPLHIHPPNAILHSRPLPPSASLPSGPGCHIVTNCRLAYKREGSTEKCKFFADSGKALRISRLRNFFNHEILKIHEKEPTLADWAVFPVWSPAFRRSGPRERGTPNGSHGARDRRRGQPAASRELNRGFQDGTG